MSIKEALVEISAIRDSKLVKESLLDSEQDGSWNTVMIVLSQMMKLKAPKKKKVLMKVTLMSLKMHWLLQVTGI